MRAHSTPSHWATACAAALALAAWWALFSYQGVTDIGYLAHKDNPSAFRWLWGRWLVDWSQTRYALNFLAVPLAAWLAWRRRTQWASGPHRVFWPALLIVALALALHILGAKAQQTRLSLLAMALLVWAIPSFAWGRSVARALAFPALALMLAMPLNFFDQMLNPVRVLAVRISAAIASGLGLAVQASGSVLIEAERRGWAIDLADSTSSVYALLTGVLIAVLVAEILHTTPFRRLLLIALAPPVFVCATILRGVTMCLLAELVSPDAAARIDQRYPALILMPWFMFFLWIAALGVRLHVASLRGRLRELMRPPVGAPPPLDREGLP